MLRKRSIRYILVHAIKGRYWKEHDPAKGMSCLECIWRGRQKERVYRLVEASGPQTIEDNDGS